MNRTLEDLALRKKVLQAQATLNRLEVQRDVQAIGGSLGWMRTGARFMGSLSVQTGLLGLALRRVAGSPIGQAVAFSSGLIVLTKILRLVMGLLRGAEPPASARDVP
jgi:hypothetical protein